MYIKKKHKKQLLIFVMHHCQKLRFCQAGAARLQTTCSAVIYLTTKYELQGPPSVKKVEMEYSQHPDY